MRPLRSTEAHQTADFAELVCSNSLKSETENSAPWLLKAEMRRANSFLLQAADAAAVPAGNALAVDRTEFSRRVADLIAAHPNIEVRREEVTQLNENDPNTITVLASGPLTSSPLAQELQRLTGADHLAFYDSISPIVDATTIDMDKVYLAARWDKGTADYINCPFTKEEYDRFLDALMTAERVEPKTWEDLPFAACATDRTPTDASSRPEAANSACADHLDRQRSEPRANDLQLSSSHKAQLLRSLPPHRRTSPPRPRHPPLRPHEARRPHQPQDRPLALRLRPTPPGKPPRRQLQPRRLPEPPQVRRPGRKSCASSPASKTPNSSATARSTATPTSTPPRCSPKRCNSAHTPASSSPANSPASKATPNPSPVASSQAVSPPPSRTAKPLSPPHAPAPTARSFTTSLTRKPSGSNPRTSPSTCFRRSPKKNANASATRKNVTASNASAPSMPGTPGSPLPRPQRSRRYKPFTPLSANAVTPCRTHGRPGNPVLRFRPTSHASPQRL